MEEMTASFFLSPIPGGGEHKPLAHLWERGWGEGGGSTSLMYLLLNASLPQ